MTRVAPRSLLPCWERKGVKACKRNGKSKCSLGPPVPGNGGNQLNNIVFISNCPLTGFGTMKNGDAPENDAAGEPRTYCCFKPDMTNCTK